MKISVIIPVFNRIKSLKTAIESVLCQTYRNFEIIVINDGSKFSLEKHLHPYQHKVRLIEFTKNQGVSFARNIGIEKSNGDFIAFLDSDDIWLPFKLKLQIDFLKKHNLNVVHTDEFWWKKGIFINQGKRHIKYGGKILTNILDICRISPSSVLIKKDIFYNIGLFDTKLMACEDYDLWLRLSSQYEIGYIPLKTIIKRYFLQNHLSSEIKHLEYLRLLSLCKFLKNTKKINFIERKNIHDEINKKFFIVKQGINKKRLQNRNL
jgi:glycosyltransferase involved in cell wall biosynthesis